MKKLINFFKKNLTHKILPILAVFLLVFNMLFIGKVEAFSVNEIKRPDDNVIRLIEGFEEYNRYDDFLFFINGYGSIVNNYQVVFFNGRYDNVKPYFDYYRGYPTLYFNKNVTFIRYVIDPISLDVILRETISSNLVGHVYYSSSFCLFYGNICVYEDSSFSKLFYDGNPFKKPYFGESEESLNNLTGGYCLIFPGDIPHNQSLHFRLIYYDSSR